MREMKNSDDLPAGVSSDTLSKIIGLDEEESSQGSYTEGGQTFAELFEESHDSKQVASGQIVEGRVVSVSEEAVLIDVGYKAEGEVPISELQDAHGKVTVNVGEKISVYVSRMENDRGLLTLSKEKADLYRAWDEIAEACRQGDILEGTVLKVVKGGLMVDIGVKAFLPSSQIDVRPVRNLEQFIGKSFRFKVIKFNKKRGNIVLSRRSVLEMEREKLKTATLDQLKVGAIVRGNVKNVTDYGAFIDLGGIDGLLHITDLSWGRVKHPKDVVSVGEELNLRILKFDQEKERVSLGLKQTQPDPWLDIHNKFITGQRVTGKVVSLTDYGAFVEIEEGIEGLIHVSEMSWTKKIKDPRKVLELDQDVDSIILDVDMEARRLSLGLKQISPNPWDTLELKYPQGTRVKGTIKNITDFGIFVEIEEGIDGLVHVSDLSWDESITHPSQLHEKGQEVEAVVVNIDKENERVSLSIKLLSGDPWVEYTDANPVGTSVEGEVTKLANFGVFVKLADRIEGMIHISELSEERVAHPESVVNIGDKVKAEIINVDRNNRKISLSVKALGLREEREALQSYQGSSAGQGSSFADTLDPEIAAKLGLIKPTGNDDDSQDS